MTVIYEAKDDKPHFCTTANASLPVGSICRCDCGRFWLRKTVIGDYWVYRWVPVRWYHRTARRRITEWKRQRRIRPIVQSIIAGEPQTLTNKTIQDYGANLLPVGEPRLTINGEPLTREAAEMLAKLHDTVPGEGWREGDRPGGETPVQTWMSEEPGPVMPYLHCRCGHSIYAHYPTGQCDNPGCSQSCADVGFEQCDCKGEKNR